MLARILSLMVPDWRTVATARRSTTFAGASYPLHGMIDRNAVRVSYSLVLQETPNGRRRLAIRCPNPAASKSDLKRDPVAQAGRDWTRGGDVPPSYRTAMEG